MSSEHPASFAQVAVLAQLGRAGGLFSYGVPPDLLLALRCGSLVRVPFATRQVQGIVCSLDQTCDLPRVRPIAEILDPLPVVTPLQLRLARWIAGYYVSSLSDVLLAMVPPGLGRKTVYHLESGQPNAGARLTPTQEHLLQVVAASPGVAQDDALREIDGDDAERALASLLRRKLIRRTASLSGPRISARTVEVASLAPAGLDALRSASTLERAPRRRAVLDYLHHHGATPVATLAAVAGASRPVIRVLTDRGLIAVERVEARRSPVNGAGPDATSAMTPSSAQTRALAAVVRSLRSGSPERFLLHGVTGSGKTEVYLQAVSETLRLGRQAIVMVPEISLTPQAVERFAGRFPGRVAVLHSKLSGGERLDEWERIRQGEADVVVGPRSALFAPLARPGLIVVDEEHDASYKQDSAPRYHARDAAAVLGRVADATVLLGSATPDVATYHAARAGRIRLLELPDRPVWDASGAAPRPMPSVELVDLRQELKSGNRSIFSTSLLSALDATLARGEQALLFLNRRGAATVVLCRDCGYVARCPACEIPFTYHLAGARLVCHRCDRRAPSPRHCPKCGSVRIRYLGVGTQRVEEEIRAVFPRARTLRWDRDVTGGKDAHERILRAFHRHEADILVGTQMIAKGLDFPLVTLVGVISADTGLHMPDFRAPERSFQLLTQVEGRAGRASLPSRVIVQTYTPEHYAIQAAQQHDYHRFYGDEMAFRRQACYPPFAHLVRFVYSDEGETLCRRAGDNLRSVLERAIMERAVPGADVIGPAPCFVERVKNRYYWQLILRAPATTPRSALHGLIEYVPPGWSIDVDPVDLL